MWPPNQAALRLFSRLRSACSIFMPCPMWWRGSRQKHRRSQTPCLPVRGAKPSPQTRQTTHRHARIGVIRYRRSWPHLLGLDESQTSHRRLLVRIWLIGLEHPAPVIHAVPGVLYARSRAVLGAVEEFPEQPVQFVCHRKAARVLHAHRLDGRDHGRASSEDVTVPGQSELAIDHSSSRLLMTRCTSSPSSSTAPSSSIGCSS